MQEELAEVFERSDKDPSALSTKMYNSTVIKNELKRLLDEKQLCIESESSNGDCAFLNSPEIVSGERCDEECRIYFKLLKDSCNAPDTILLTKGINFDL